MDKLTTKIGIAKLQNMFTVMNPQTIAELYFAQNEEFRLTLEALLTVTGQLGKFRTPMELKKFIAEKEKELGQELLMIKRKAISEVDWPLLKDVKVDMVVVKLYRKQALDHLRYRDINFGNAQNCYKEGSFVLATHYQEATAYHKQKLEQANSMAAISLMQYHANNNPADNNTIDLHYLRVGEAKEFLDLFLDSHIIKAREMQHKYNVIWCHKLYFITGRGLHSIGEPKLKPAVTERLKERGLLVTLSNPGQLSSNVFATSLLCHEVKK